MKHPIAHLFKGIKEDYNWLSPELCGEVYNLCRDTLFENVDGIKFYMWLNLRAKSPLIPKSRAKTQIKYLVHRLSGMIDTDKDPVQHIDTSVSDSFSELEDDLGDAILRGLGDAKRKELLIKTWEKRVIEMCGISYEDATKHWSSFSQGIDKDKSRRSKEKERFISDLDSILNRYKVQAD